jgi:aspartate/methionine/tyrosine aminotransferase
VTVGSAGALCLLVESQFYAEAPVVVGKQFSATGWRVGWLIGPANLIRPSLAASTRVTFTTNSPLQEAVATGFEKAEERQFFESVYIPIDAAVAGRR